MTKLHRRLNAALASLPMLALAGCFEASDVSLAPPSVAPLSPVLERAADCTDLLGRLQADATARVEMQAFRLAESYEGYMPGGTGILYDAGVVYSPSVGIAADSAGGGTPRHTETNTQVAGVDETDFVETDGLRVYLLHDRELIVLTTAPVGTADELARLTIEGTPRSMFVDAGRAVVFSDLWTYGSGGTPIAADVAFPYWGATVGETKITVLDVSGATPVVTSEHYVEGSFVDARRHGDVVRALVQFDGMTSFEWRNQPSPYDASGNLIGRRSWTARVVSWRDERLAEIAASTLDDFLPEENVVGATGRTRVAPRCDQMFLPEPGQFDDGLLSVLTFATSSPDAVDATTILGRAGVVYASQDWLVVAQQDLRFDTFLGVASQESAVHAFSLAGATTTYAASTKVSGNVPSQFALDESGGVLRVASFEWMRTGADPTVGPTPILAEPPATSATHITTFRLGASAVTELGQSPDLGLGEQLRAVRFVDDRAYVVTFRQVDPLFVIDMSDPTAPTVRGEVEIPGFSTYMHPLDPTHLLTIGTEIDPVTNQNLGMSLQIFDVTDPSAPTLVQKTVVPMANSAAQYDHKAFVFDALTGILAIPVESYGVAFESALELYDVSITAGITLRGTVAHTTYYQDCNAMPVGSTFPIYGCSYPATMRRGLMIGDHVYAISYRAVTTHPLADLATTTDTFVLPMPAFTYDGFGFVRAL